MKAKERLHEWFEKVRTNNGRMDREDVTFIMVQSRHLIEMDQSPEDYKMVKFYADWTLHTAIDRSEVIYEVLRNVTVIIIESMKYSKPNVVSEISREIGFPVLRKQMKILFSKYGLSTAIFDYKVNWINFISFLLWFIESQPIAFPVNPNKRSKQIIAEIEAMDNPKQLFVEALAIVRHEDTFHWKLIMGGGKRFDIMGQVEVTEPDEAFISI